MLSSRPKTVSRRGSVSFVNPATVDLADLFTGMRRVAVIGGARVYREMVDAGLLDELYLTVEPLLFGRGQALVSGGVPIQLHLLSSRRLNRRGSLLLRYRVER